MSCCVLPLRYEEDFIPYKTEVLTLKLFGVYHGVAKAVKLAYTAIRPYSFCALQLVWIMEWNIGEVCLFART